jgi:hypothetical protein
MADQQSPTPPAAAPDAANAAFDAARPAAAAKPAKDAAKEIARAAEAVVARTAEASRETATAGAEAIAAQVETAQSSVRSGLESSASNIEGLTRTWSQMLGGGSNPDLGQASTQTVGAISGASTALAKGVQDASKAWLDLTQKTMRSNLDAMRQLAGVRSVPELIAVQSNLLRGNLQQAIESGETLARVSGDAIREATQAIQSGVQRAS